MQRFALSLAIAVSTLAGSTAGADTIFDAQRRVEMAALRARLYEQVEYPAELRRLRSELQLAEAEVASLERLLKEYGPFDKFSTGRPLVLTIEATELGLLRARLRRDNLRAELTALQRFRSDRLRLLRLEMQEAAALAR